MALQQLHRTSLVTEAYNQIRNAITGGTLAPGTPLVETRLAEELGISRPPLREALVRLRAEGLVVATQRGGAEVAGLDSTELVEMYNLRTAIEVTAGRLASVMGADTAPLRRAVEHMRKAGEREHLAGVLDADVAFHHGICEVTGSQVLVRAFDAVAGRVRMALSIDDATYEHLTAIADEHVPLIDAIDSRDNARIVRVISEHIFAGAMTTLARLGADDALLLRPLAQVGD